jgi:hypothetical protein
MIEIQLQIIWGSSKEDCEKMFKLQFGNFKRWKLFPICFNRKTIDTFICTMIAYSFNLPE